MRAFSVIFFTLFSFIFSEIHDVSIANFSFTPSTLEITEGDTVRWTNNATSNHTSLSTSNPVVWNSGTISPGNTFEFQFDDVGEFPYRCGFHSSMTGDIIVSSSSLGNNNLNSPNEILIYSAYPNPFNPSTTISFYLNQYHRVSVDIYNLKGQIIENLLNQHLTPGQYEIIWDATQKVGGLYVVKITAGSHVNTQKIMLIK